MPLTDDDTMLFGTHKGLKMSQVPMDYLEWYVREYCQGAFLKLTYTQKLIRRYVESKQQKPL